MKERLMFYYYTRLVQDMASFISGCRLMVWSSLPFDLELYKQATQGLQGKDKKGEGVQIHSFITKGTVEPKKYTTQ